MDDDEKTQAIANRLLDANMYMTVATADAGGRPWASPVWFASSDYAAFFWVSDPESRHSRNIAVRPEIAIVIFDSNVPVGAAQALYVEAIARPLSGDDLVEALATYSARSTASGARAWSVEDFQPPSRFQMYRAEAVSMSVLGPGDKRLPLRTYAESQVEEEK